MASHSDYISTFFHWHNQRIGLHFQCIHGTSVKFSSGS